MSEKNKYDSLMNSLDDYSKKAVDNVNELSTNIKKIKDQVLEDSESNLKEIKESIVTLKRNIYNTIEKVENLPLNMYKDEHSLRTKLYSTLINSKNEMFGYNLSNIDSIFKSLDDFDNTRDRMIKNVLTNFEISYKKNNENSSRLISILHETLLNESDIYNKYQVQLKESLNTIKDALVLLSDNYSMSIKSHNEKVDVLKAEFESKTSTTTEGYIDLLLNYNNIENILNNSFKEKEKELVDDYKENLEKNRQEFEEISKRDIKHLETILANELELDDLFRNKEVVFKELYEDLAEAKNKKAIMAKIEKATNKKELADIITKAYIHINKDTYDKYVSLNKKLESEFKTNYNKLRSEHIKSRYLSKTNKLDSIMNESFKNLDKEQLNDEAFIEYMNKRYEENHEFTKTYLKMKNLIDQLEINFNYVVNMIMVNLKNELEMCQNKFETDSLIVKEDLAYETSSYELLFSTLYKEELKNIALLDYEIKVQNLHKNFIASKAKMSISSDLFNCSRELDLLKPRYELTKILDEYNISKLSLENLYKSEVSLLDKTKEREELNLLSNYKFMISMMEHQILSANELIELTKKDYELRVDILANIKEVNNQFKKDRIDKEINGYLKNIQDINEIKEIKLNTLSQKLKLLPTVTDETYLSASNEFSKILEEFEEIKKEMYYLVSNSDQITIDKEDVEKTNELIIDSIATAQDIRDKSAEQSLKYLKNIESSFDAMIASLNSYETTDYAESFNQYKLNFIFELNRLNDNLDKISTPQVDLINHIEHYYREDIYKVKLQELNRAHTEAANAFYKELMDKYTSIDESDNTYNTKSITVSEHNEILDEINLTQARKAKEQAEAFERNKEALKKNFEKEIKLSNEKLNQNLARQDQKFEVEIQDLSSKANEIFTINKSSLKINKRFNKIINKKYPFELEAFKHDELTKMDKLNRDIEEKYKNISVYELKGKDIK